MRINNEQAENEPQPARTVKVKPAWLPCRRMSPVPAACSYLITLGPCICALSPYGRREDRIAASRRSFNWSSI